MTGDGGKLYTSLEENPLDSCRGFTYDDTKVMVVGDGSTDDTGGGEISMNYTYMVKCADGSLYTGWTNDLEKRMEAHNSGSGAKYTRGRSPVELVYFEEFETKEEAMSREWHIKRLTRYQKLKLIEGNKK